MVEVPFWFLPAPTRSPTVVPERRSPHSQAKRTPSPPPFRPVSRSKHAHQNPYPAVPRRSRLTLRPNKSTAPRPSSRIWTKPARPASAKSSPRTTFPPRRWTVPAARAEPSPHRRSIIQPPWEKPSIRPAGVPGWPGRCFPMEPPSSILPTKAVTSSGESSSQPPIRRTAMSVQSRSLVLGWLNRPPPHSPPRPHRPRMFFPSGSTSTTHPADSRFPRR